MAASYLVTQIPEIVTDAYKDIMGITSNSEIDTTDIVSMGKALSSFDLLDGWYGKLANRIIKTVVFARTYSADTRKILRDEHTWGAFIQKLYVTAPDFVDNPAFAPTSNYVQPSPYDVDTLLSVDSMIYGNEGTWSMEFLLPEVQIRKAFTGPAEMNAFVDGQFVAVQNKLEVAKESLINAACNTGIAAAINSGLSRNLLTEYNTGKAEADQLTAAEALVNKDFLKYAAKEIMTAVKFMKKPSVKFNAKGYETFSPAPVVELLTSYKMATEMYLDADTFHQEYTNLNGTEVPYWQSFDAPAKINVANDAINSGTAVEQDGIIACIRDDEYVAAYFGDEYQWSMPNPRARVSIHGYQYKKGFAVDEHANVQVFIVADVESDENQG